MDDDREIEDLSKTNRFILILIFFTEWKDYQRFCLELLFFQIFNIINFVFRIKNDKSRRTFFPFVLKNTKKLLELQFKLNF